MNPSIAQIDRSSEVELALEAVQALAIAHDDLSGVKIEGFYSLMNLILAPLRQR